MGALAKAKHNLRESKVGLLIRDALGAFIGMVNSVGENDVQTVEEAVKATIENENNPKLIEEYNKYIEIGEMSDKALNEKANNQFNTSKTFGIDLNEKDGDGYNKIPNKLKEIKTSVSEREALNNGNNREKGGKQKTRVDED